MICLAPQPGAKSPPLVQSQLTRDVTCRENRIFLILDKPCEQVTDLLRNSWCIHVGLVGLHVYMTVIK